MEIDCTKISGNSETEIQVRESKNEWEGSAEEQEIGSLVDRPLKEITSRMP